MARSTKPILTSGAGSLIAAVWGAYSYGTAIADLPANSGRFAHMMADPPIYLPWLILAVCIMVLAWSLWPSEKRKPDEHADKSVRNPTQNHTGSGDNNMHF